MVAVQSKIPFDKDPSKYRRSWIPTQEEQDAYDDLQRRKVNPQFSDYVQDGQLICFGISEHLTEERLPEWTPRAIAEMKAIDSWFPKRQLKEVTRPAYKSDFNYTNYATRAQLRVGLGLLAIRELPIKNFYARCGLAYCWIVYYIIRGSGRGFRNNRPAVFWNHTFHSKALVNHPDLLNWTMTRVLPKNPPVPDAHREWMTRQMPVYHQYHKNVYRYRYRRPRFVKWDGSQNQPVMPFMHDNGTEVNNGTFKRNCATTPQLR